MGGRHKTKTHTRTSDAEEIVGALRAAFSEFASDEIHPLRADVIQLFEYVRGNGRPGLVQQAAILEERLGVTADALDKAEQAIDRLQNRLYLLVVGVGLALLGAVLSFLLH